MISKVCPHCKKNMMVAELGSADAVIFCFQCGGTSRNTPEGPRKLHDDEVLPEAVESLLTSWRRDLSIRRRIAAARWN